MGNDFYTVSTNAKSVEVDADTQIKTLNINNRSNLVKVVNSGTITQLDTNEAAGTVSIDYEGVLPTNNPADDTFKEFKYLVKADTGTAISANACENKTYITNITLAKGVTSIGESAFAGCTSLKEVRFNEMFSTLTSIDASAFSGTAIKSIVLPASVNKVGVSLFDSCTSLTDIHVMAEVPPAPLGASGDLLDNTSQDVTIWVPHIHDHPGDTAAVYEAAAIWKETSNRSNVTIKEME